MSFAHQNHHLETARAVIRRAYRDFFNSLLAFSSSEAVRLADAF